MAEGSKGLDFLRVEIYALASTAAVIYQLWGGQDIPAVEIGFGFGNGAT